MQCLGWVVVLQCYAGWIRASVQSHPRNSQLVLLMAASNINTSLAPSSARKTSKGSKLDECSPTLGLTPAVACITVQVLWDCQILCFILSIACSVGATAMSSELIAVLSRISVGAGQSFARITSDS